MSTPDKYKIIRRWRKEKRKEIEKNRNKKNEFENIKPKIFIKKEIKKSFEVRKIRKILVFLKFKKKNFFCKK